MLEQKPVMDASALDRMGKIALECVKKPNRPSFWLEGEGTYICPERNEVHSEDRPRFAPSTGQKSERIDAKFKLVFITAAVGTIMFTLICVTLHLATNGELPPARKELSDSILTMAKIGFGAIVGMLGGKAL